MRFQRRALLRMIALSPAALTKTSTGRSAGGPKSLDIHDQIVDQAKNAPLKMRFLGTTKNACVQWQNAFSQKLGELLGPYQPPSDWQTQQKRTVELSDHYREELVLHAEGHTSLPIFLLRPKTASSNRLPGVVAVHGHGVSGYYGIAGVEEQPGVTKFIREVNCDYGRQLVQQGYLVAVPCLAPFGPRLGDGATYGGKDACAVTFVRMQLLGKVLMAENLRDVLWAVELLSRQESVNPNRLGCVGLSYGGRMTMLASALEKRIRVAVCSGCLNVMQERITIRYSCGAQVIPGLLEYGDVPEIASLTAPRPCLWEIGSRDGLISPEWAERALSRIRKAYGAYGAEEQLMVDRFNGGHQWHGKLAYPLLEQVLAPRAAVSD
jgi:dienelactone hydrolase